jgi:hypothetical protein
MARIRTIKPDFWTDEKVVDVGPWERLLFIGLWTFADDQGYIDDKARKIKMQVFPGDDLTVDDVTTMLERLVEVSLVDRYDGPEGPVLHIRHWERHQRIDRPSAPRFKPGDLQIRRALASDPKPIRRALAPEGKGREGKGSTTGSYVAFGSRGGPGGNEPPPADAGRDDGKPKRRSHEGTRCPDNFADSVDHPLTEWARAHAPDVNIRTETERFVDYWIGVPGSRGIKRSWPATWRNWMRKAQEDIVARRPRNGVAVRSTADARAQAGLDLANELKKERLSLQRKNDSNQLQIGM